MANQIEEFQNEIIRSLLISPCTEDDLNKRDFLKTKSLYGIGKTLQRLECLECIYYKGKSDIMYISKKWIKKNRPYLLDD